MQFPSHVIEAQDHNGRLVIVKRPRKNSRELLILRKLASQHSPNNHAIPLLQTVESSLGPLLVFPRAIPFTDRSVLEHNVQRRFTQTCHQLVRGVTYLHAQMIAHCDLKPDNLVYDPNDNGRLYIIDFDLAMQCESVDEMVESSCGTEGWTAPEIELDDRKPQQAFSPIRADLWACGKMLSEFEKIANQAEVDKDMSVLHTLLMDFDPKRRPLLHEIVDEQPDLWTSGRFRQALTHHRNSMLPTGDSHSKRARDDEDDNGKEGQVQKLRRGAPGNATKQT